MQIKSKLCLTYNHYNNMRRAKAIIIIELYVHNIIMQNSQVGVRGLLHIA